MADVTESPVADLAECLAAIEALSDADLRKLNGYARFMAYNASGVFRFADAEDLLHESVARTLDGRRRWKPQQVDFKTHIKGCIRSITDEYAQEAVRYSDQGVPERPPGSSNERRINYLIFAKARSHLQRADDAIAVAVFDRLLEERTPAEVRQILNIDEAVYNAARKRISRCMKRVFSDGRLRSLFLTTEQFYGEPYV